MLTDKEAAVVLNLVIMAEDYIEETGGCDHNANICYCAVTVDIVQGYGILHSNGFGEHEFITDYEWNGQGDMLPVLRCRQCYGEKSTA